MEELKRLVFINKIIKYDLFKKNEKVLIITKTERIVEKENSKLKKKSSSKQKF